MTDFDPQDYMLQGNEQIIIQLLRSLLIDWRYTVCYWDDNDGRREYVKSTFAATHKDTLRCEPMKLSGAGMPHYDISVFVNANQAKHFVKDFRFVAVMANLDVSL